MPRAYSCVARSGKPFLPPFAAALVRCASETSIARNGSRSRKFRERTSCTSMSAVSMPTPITRAMQSNHRVGPSPGACSIRSRRASSICADLITDEPPALHVAMQLSPRVGRQRFALGRAQIFEALRRPCCSVGIEAADAQPDQRCFHSVDNPRSLSDEALALAVRPLGIFVLGRRDRHHACSDLARRAASRERRASAARCRDGRSSRAGARATRLRSMRG